jgi:hypothetical protein
LAGGTLAVYRAPEQIIRPAAQSVGCHSTVARRSGTVASSKRKEEMMKTINKSAKEIVKEVWQAFVGIGRHFVRTLDHMSWPAIVGMCIVIALFLTILPLAITLFIGVLIAKLAINAFGNKKQHG